MATKTIALIDGDVYAYEIASASERPIKWDDDLWTLHACEKEAKEALVSRIHSLAETVGADEIIVALSDRENFRKEILPSYKENRAHIRRPMILGVLKEFIQEEFNTFIRPGLEGDDVLGILSTWKKLKGRKIVITVDKDFNTIPGTIYYSNSGELVEVSEHEANRAHMMQTLTGDPADGYYGCPSIGPVTAAKILDEVLDEGTPWADQEQLYRMYWDAVVETYAKKGLSEEEALVQARVARILRASDYDFKGKKPILWTPPTN